MNDLPLSLRKDCFCCLFWRLPPHHQTQLGLRIDCCCQISALGVKLQVSLWCYLQLFWGQKTPLQQPNTEFHPENSVIKFCMQSENLSIPLRGMINAQMDHDVSSYSILKPLIFSHRAFDLESRALQCYNQKPILAVRSRACLAY